jgi:hypothetical protein
MIKNTASNFVNVNKPLSSALVLAHKKLGQKVKIRAKNVFSFSPRGIWIQNQEFGFFTVFSVILQNDHHPISKQLRYYF